ncbi:MAG: hypothetical protein HY072_06620, partial [Deltaproteobacteria bacterium]|nr:hypothetical protein [Deltaproteobacteria bacterium]
MKGLESIPTPNDLLKAYNTLQFKQKMLLPSKLAFWSQWSRFDPRLAEIIVFYISKNWKDISALTLNREIKKQPWPGVLGVLLEQVILFAGFSLNEKVLFRNWARFVMTGVSKASFELFFIGLRSLGGRLSLQDAVLSHKTYKKWGYFGRELLINKVPEKA